jgi:hypothetical protein
MFSRPVYSLENTVPMSFVDLDPFVDINITVEIQAIRSLEKFEYPHPVFEKIDWLSDPDFYMKIRINQFEYRSQIWRDTRYVYEPKCKFTVDVPDDVEFVNVSIELWDWNLGLNRRCDISGDHEGYRDSFDVELVYSVKTGHWWGDDYTSNEPVETDKSGYGRLCGCDDNSVYQRERDAEVWFDISQNDFDSDGIPYWTEMYVYHTDPECDNRGDDSDGDGVPIEWEHHWGHFYSSWGQQHYWYYDPFSPENHALMDPDLDGLDNVEEYLTWQWGSDPFRQDIFVELDQMEPSSEGVESVLPEGSKELIRTSFHRQNIVWHLDDGCMGGSEWIPFDALTPREDLEVIYWEYFLHGDENNWRRGVFHYGIVVYDATYAGYVFWGNVGPYLDAYQISSSRVNKKAVPNTQRYRDIAYASVYMHELGHTLGIFNSNTPGCDDQLSKRPRMPNFWKWGQYKSCMNYRYTYRLVDYSDGSRGRNDFDDWDRIDLTFFQRPFQW